MKNILILSYTGMTLIDVVLMIVLCVNVYDLQLYERPDYKPTPYPYEVSLTSKIVVGFGTVLVISKAIGLISAFYNIHLVTKDKEFKDGREQLR